MAEHKPKRGIELLINNATYSVKKEMSVEGVWDITIKASQGTGRSDTYEKVLANNILGSKEAVTRLAQEAFGCETGGYHYKYDWRIIPSKVTVESVDVEQLLHDLEIEAKPIPDDPTQKKRK